MSEGTRPTARARSATALIVGGIALFFAAFLLVLVWAAPYAVYLLLSGVLLVVLGFAVASRSK